MLNPYPVFRDAAADRKAKHDKDMLRKKKRAVLATMNCILIVGIISAFVSAVITYFITK